MNFLVTKFITFIIFYSFVGANEQKTIRMIVIKYIFSFSLLVKVKLKKNKFIYIYFLTLLFSLGMYANVVQYLQREML